VTRRFLSMMSHDLRTPLTAISGYAELISSDPRAAGELAEHAEEIRRASHDVGRLIEDILAFAQLDSGRVIVRPAAVPLSESFARAEALVRMRVQESNISLVMEGCEGLAANADPDRLQQILLNLLTNAIKFTPPGGRIEVRCSQAGERVLIRIADTGIGIPEDQLEHVFEPFVQLNPKQGSAVEGVGLGLAISRDLARAMHGDLSASVEPGAGAVFTLDLPAAMTSTTA
jgi:signal transduction histidine kinase